jgi:hypothetical protein
MNSTSQQDETLFTSRALEVVIRLGVILLIVTWCFQIIQPFIIFAEKFGSDTIYVISPGPVDWSICDDIEFVD